MAIDMESAANAALVFVTGLLGWFGIKRGLKGGGVTVDQIEGAGAVVDAAAMREVTKSIADHGAAVHDLTAAIEKHTRAGHALRDEIEELRREMALGRSRSP